MERAGSSKERSRGMISGRLLIERIPILHFSHHHLALCWFTHMCRHKLVLYLWKILDSVKVFHSIREILLFGLCVGLISGEDCGKWKCSHTKFNAWWGFWQFIKTRKPTLLFRICEHDEILISFSRDSYFPLKTSIYVWIFDLWLSFAGNELNRQIFSFVLDEVSYFHLWNFHIKFLNFTSHRTRLSSEFDCNIYMLRFHSHKTLLMTSSRDSREHHTTYDIVHAKYLFEESFIYSK